jgi:hypothetical protein
MAQARQQISDLAQVNQRIASFGIMPEEAVSKPIEGGQQDQDTGADKAAGSDEREGADAPVDGADSDVSADTLDTEGEDIATDGDEPDKAQQDSRIADYEARLKRADEMERKWQSRHDRVQALLDRALAQQHGRTQTTTTDGGSDLGIPDNDDLVSNKDLRKLIGNLTSRQQEAQEGADTSNRRQQWVAARPDVQDVVKYMQANDLYAEDSPLRGIPTDEIGLYAIAKSMKLEAALKDADKRVVDEVAKARADERKKLLKTGAKPRIPDTGGNGAPRISRGHGESLEPVSKSEQDYLRFFERLGTPAQIVSVRRG